MIRFSSPVLVPIPITQAPFRVIKLTNPHSEALVQELNSLKSGEQLTVGSHPENHIQITQDNRIYPYQGVFGRTELGEIYYKDTETRNSSTLNGVPLAPRIMNPLQKGDRLVIAKSGFSNYTLDELN